MAWNEPGRSGEKDPWGGQRKKPGEGPPDLDQILRNLQEKLRALFGGRKGDGPGGGGLGGLGASGFGIGLIVLVALALWLLSGFYVINQGERGVILRFGKKTALTEAGLRWRLPFPIEQVEKVNVEKVYPLEIGYRSSPRTGDKSVVPKEALMLTEDENIIDIEFAVQYKIKDANDYLFNVHNPASDPEATIRQATESAVREAVGKSTLDFVLTEGRDQVNQNTRELLQQIMDRYRSGIHIVAVEMQRAQPPEEVKTAFDDAVKAREDEQRLKNEAEAYANDIIPRARGGAARMLQEAEGYKASVVARADGDARRFKAVAGEYVKAPGVTRERLYLETMEQVLSNSTTIYVDQKAGGNILYLPLDKLMRLPEPAAGPETAQPASPESETGGAPAGAGRTRTDLRRRTP
ncbi:MAG: HflK protein [Candidatus Muproteobacteria bacterium RIFCSPHIGHO2_02_FULL_65_16]|uniref:Protein HflK n=1 Tax=Candidatus Muproteobacteria bacterium RIFCSPHIGHO2_02_FULL_65_16 TaxID=1817766 RepID=A0A1F6U658_9PROT|nr:MAG: HflK protein [Candidatus Muproteobacteria bacterium RIFCSPHIGHO2_02_FULL_65_16]